MMTSIVIENMQSKTIQCGDKNERLLDILLLHSDWLHACGGKGRCTTCKINICDGEAILSSPSDAEIKYRNLNKLNENQRLSCQCFIQQSGILRIIVPKECQLPHLIYTESCF